MRLLITGTPCVGKTTLAVAVSKLLDCPLVKVNDVVEQVGCYKIGEDGAKEVDLKVLQRRLKKILESFRGGKNSVVAEGHLLCEMRLPCEKIAVLRANPKLLFRRMKKRRYGREKTAENLLAEVLDYFPVHAEDNYGRGKVVELNASKPLDAGKALRKIGLGKSDFVDWTPLLLDGRFSPEIRGFA